MKKVSLKNWKQITSAEIYEGESIEKKCRRITEEKEPISDGAPIIYTPKEEGVIPAYDIRTDRWDMAIMAMDAVNKQKIAMSKNKTEIEENVETEKKTEKGTETGTELPN